MPLLSWLTEVPEVALEVRGAPEAWYELPTGVRPWPAGKTGVAKARRPKPLVGAPALRAGREVLVRRAAVEPLVAALPAGVATLRDVALVDPAGKVLDAGFALLDVLAHAPLDRAAAEATWVDGFVDRLLAARWGADRQPRAPLFRIGETPNEVVVTDELGAALRQATGGRLGVREVASAELRTRATFAVHPAAAHPLDPTVDHLEAERAYWEVVKGARGAKARARACQSPVFAYWLARTVDGEARPDTRAGVASNAVYATLYACFVSGRAERGLEKVIASNWWAATTYGGLVRGDYPPGARATIEAAGGAFERDRKRVQRLATFLGVGR